MPADAFVGDEQVGVDVTGEGTTPSPGTLDEETVTALVQVTRAMYPHDGVPDLHYERVVAALDAKAGADPAMEQLLTEGVGYLATTTGRYPKDFGGLPEPEKVAARR